MSASPSKEKKALDPSVCQLPGEAEFFSDRGLTHVACASPSTFPPGNSQKPRERFILQQITKVRDSIIVDQGRNEHGWDAM